MFKRLLLFKKTKGRKGVPQGIGRARVLAMTRKGTHNCIFSATLLTSASFFFFFYKLERTSTSPSAVRLSGEIL